jgi:hypothetical protein
MALVESQTPSRRRQSVKGRRVGMAFERKMVKELGAWWCDDALALFRNHGSGNRSTQLGHDSGVYSGDVVPVKDSAKPWPFSIELKRSNTLTLDSILLSKASPFYGFWHQCTTDARRSQSIPLLIWAKSRQEPYVFFYEKIMAHLLNTEYEFPLLLIYPGGLVENGIVAMPLYVFKQAAKRERIVSNLTDMEHILWRTKS